MSGLIAVAFVASLPAAGLAQAPGGTGTSERRATDRAKKDRPAFTNAGLEESSEIIGAKVESADGKDLGKVEALLIDPKEGKVTHAVVGLGGVLGIGEEKVVVPYTALKMTTSERGRKARITADQAALETAPKYVKASDRSPSASPATK
jgi:sporulation protein YlmC with PRC-barrel domain